MNGDAVSDPAEPTTFGVFLHNLSLVLPILARYPSKKWVTASSTFLDFIFSFSLGLCIEPKTTK